VSLALSALVTLFLALPGFFLITTFLGAGSRKADDPVYSAGLTWAWLLALLAAPLLHAVWLGLSGFFGFHEADLSTVLYLLSGNFSDKERFDAVAVALERDAENIIGYFLTLFAGSLAAGRPLTLAVPEGRKINPACRIATNGSTSSRACFWTGVPTRY
jgi:hypothetical protein